MEKLTKCLVFWISLLLFSECVLGQPETCTSTCKDRGKNDFEFYQQRCYCDPFCHAYDDCCQDAEPSSSSMSMPAFTNDMFTCNSSIMYNGNKDVKLGVYIVDKCPATFTNEEIKSLCEDASRTNLFLNVPVNAMRTNILYRNFFCALCNEPRDVRNKTDVWFWKVSQTCFEKKSAPQNNSEDVIKVFDTTSSYCRTTFEGPEDRYRKCFVYLKDCPSSWVDSVVSELCQNHTNIVHDEEKILEVFKNEYCAECNGMNFTLCYDPLKGGNGSDAVANVAPYSFLLDFNRGFVDYKKKASTKQLHYPQMLCSNEEIYDPWTRICRTIIYQIPETEVDSTVLPCDMIRYRSHEYVTLPNKSVVVRDSSVLYTHNEYRTYESGIQVCIGNQSDTVSRWDVHGRAGGIITGVGLIISLISLSMCIFAHLVFPQLRNVPGKCVLGLSFSLFAGQILFLTTMNLETYGACYVFAIIMHYAFLASFCWMNCLSFDIFHAFSRMITGKGNELKQYIRYSVYAWGVPAICIIIAIILDFAPGVNEEYRPHYAERLCWINSGKALLLLFAVPLALILISNIVMFSITVWNIRRAKRDARKIRRTSISHSHRVLDVFLYVKLSVIMGLSWIFGFLAAASKSQVLWYFFIVFNTLQGVLLFASFVLTKRVRKLAKERSSSFKSSSFFVSFKSGAKTSVLESSGVYKSTQHTQSSAGNVSVNSESSD